MRQHLCDSAAVQGTCSFHCWFFTSARVTSEPSITYRKKVTKHLQNEFMVFSPSKARLEQMKFLAQVSVSQKPSLGNSAAATFPVNAAFIFHSLKWWRQKANYCSLVQGWLHKTATISPFCCMKNHNKSWFSYNSLESCFQELLRQALKDIDIQGKQILACHRNVIFSKYDTGLIWIKRKRTTTGIFFSLNYISTGRMTIAAEVSEGNTPNSSFMSCRDKIHPIHCNISYLMLFIQHWLHLSAAFHP